METRRPGAPRPATAANLISSHSYTLDAVGNRTQAVDFVLPAGTYSTIPDAPGTPNPAPTDNRIVAQPGTPGASPSGRDVTVSGSPLASPDRVAAPPPGSPVTTTYAYDRISQLRKVNGTQVLYDYDSAGNRSKLTRGATVTNYTYDRADRILTAAVQGGVTTTFTVNDLGNITNRQPGANPADGTTYTYDQANRLKTVTVGSGPPSTYTYDGAGNRISKTVGTAPNQTVTNYTYDVNRGLPVLLDDGTRRYVWGVGLAYAVQGSGASETIEVFHTDGLGSVRAITDASVVIVEDQSTDEYGNVGQVDGTHNQPYGFAGEQRDQESGLIWLRSRTYDPSIGRFLQRDRYPGRPRRPLSLNNYTYAENNPVNNTDPSGRMRSPKDRQRLPDIVPPGTTGPIIDIVPPLPDNQGGFRAPDPLPGIGSPCGDSPAESISCPIDVPGQPPVPGGAITATTGDEEPREAPKDETDDDPEISEASAPHIFRDEEGHFTEDTPENRELIREVAGDPANYLGHNKSGVDWYAKILPDGRQVWVRVRDGKITNAGINETPRTWDPDRAWLVR
ncbi:MAG: RHS repeat-associated core domain-containing protein [Chloroflexota bacterium]